MWCGQSARRAGGRTQEQHALLIGDPHPPDRVRVNQALQNHPPFAEAFGCAVGCANSTVVMTQPRAQAAVRRVVTHLTVTRVSIKEKDPDLCLLWGVPGFHSDTNTVRL